LADKLTFEVARLSTDRSRVRWLSANPDKRRTELALLAYSPVWMGVVTAIMFGVDLSRWGDLEHLALGFGLALPPWVIGLRGRGYARRFILIVTLHSFIQNYFGSRMFFDVFGMEYHFRVSAPWIWNGTPAFLYLLTVAYFATYYVLLGIGWRAFRSRFPGAGPTVRVLVRGLLCYAVAFAETATMANETLSAYFRYRDAGWVMRWGSIGYGILFFVTLPQLADLDEEGPSAQPWPRLVRDALAANLIVLILYELYGFAMRAL
jgi:hypothetical protein